LRYILDEEKFLKEREVQEEMALEEKFKNQLVKE